MSEQKIFCLQKILSDLEPIHRSVLISNLLIKSSSDLFNLLLNYHLPKDVTVSKLRDVLLSDLSKESTILQGDQWISAIDNKILIRGRNRLTENKRKELDQHHHLSDLIQLCYSADDHYVFLAHGEEKFPFTSLILDPNRIPKTTLKTLSIENLDPDLNNFKSLFEKFIPLEYYFDSKNKTTNRVGFVDGKSLLFRKNITVFEPELYPYTSGEKRKSEIEYSMNAYDTGFDLLRSQEYTVASETESISEYTDLQNEIKLLLQEIVNETKHSDLKNILNELISEISEAKSFYVLASKLYNLEKISFKNKGIDSKHLEGAFNKFQKRIDELSGKVAYIEAQRHAIEQLMGRYLADFFSFYSDVLLCLEEPNFSKKHLFSLFDGFLRKGVPLFDPFYSFYSQIKKLLGGASSLESQLVSRVVLVSQVLLRTQRMVLQQKRYDHFSHLGKAEGINKPEFDLYLLKKYPDLAVLFSSHNIDDINVDEIVKLLESI